MYSTGKSRELHFDRSCLLGVFFFNFAPISDVVVEHGILIKGNSGGGSGHSVLVAYHMHVGCPRKEPIGKGYRFGPSW